MISQKKVLIAYFVEAINFKKIVDGTDTCHVFNNYLNLWHSKNQVSVALFTIEVEYVAAENYCALNTLARTIIS